jgi:hypothetical protein
MSNKIVCSVFMKKWFVHIASQLPDKLVEDVVSGLDQIARVMHAGCTFRLHRIIALLSDLK